MRSTVKCTFGGRLLICGVQSPVSNGIIQGLEYEKEKHFRVKRWGDLVLGTCKCPLLNATNFSVKKEASLW